MSATPTTWPTYSAPPGALPYGAVSTFTHLPGALGIGGVSASTNWPSANLAIYVPIEVPTPFNVAKIAWYNGSTVAGSVDAGIYSTSGTLLVSTGATAQSGTSAIQSVDITDYQLPAGVYLLGILNTSTGRIAYFAPGNTGLLQLMGCAQEATGGTLPATWTPAAVGQAVLPLIALLSDTRIG